MMGIFGAKKDKNAYPQEPHTRETRRANLPRPDIRPGVQGAVRRRGRIERLPRRSPEPRRGRQNQDATLPFRRGPRLPHAAGEKGHPRHLRDNRQRAYRRYQLPETISIWICNFDLPRASGEYIDEWTLHSTAALRNGKSEPLSEKNRYIWRESSATKAFL